jgi:hypothetical protein
MFFIGTWLHQNGTTGLIMFFIGTWLHQNGTDGCEPTSGDCYYDPEGENDQVRCRTNLNYFVVFALNIYHSVSAALDALGPSIRTLLQRCGSGMISSGSIRILPSTLFKSFLIEWRIVYNKFAVNFKSLLYF